MSTGFIDIILLAMIAGFIILRLRSVLGRRTGHEGPPQSAPGKLQPADGPDDRTAIRTDDNQEAEVIPLNVDSKTRRALTDISRADHSFDLERFLAGARQAYEMILDAFWKSDKDTLRKFLSKDVYDQFVSAIDERERKGHKHESRILDITEMKIVDAAFEDNTAEITLAFESDVVLVVRDEDGKLVEGNISDTIKVDDVWTFARDVDTDDPNWILVSTRSD